MSIGLGIFLIALGAVLTYAVNVTITWIDLDLVGYILMVAGVLVVIFGIVLLTRKRRSTVTTSRRIDPQTGERTDTSERGDSL